MISMDGAALIAQVYPVGVLLLVLEARALKPYPRTVPRWLRVWRFFLVFTAGIAITGSLLSVAFCVQAVSSGDPLPPYPMWVVTIAGWSLALSVFALAWEMFLRAIQGEDSRL